MRVKAVWNGEVIAESGETVVVEGNHYFPSDSINSEYLEPSDRKSRCFWKGEASYYDINVTGQRNPAAAWYYPDPSGAAAKIKGYVAFWRGVQVVEADET